MTSDTTQSHPVEEDMNKHINCLDGPHWAGYKSVFANGYKESDVKHCHDHTWLCSNNMLRVRL